MSTLMRPIDSRTAAVKTLRSQTPTPQPATHRNSAASQRARIIDRLQLGPASTIDIRCDQDVLAVGVRIHELRNLGYRIDTIWTHQETHSGQVHRVAKYVLRPGKVS
jgi:hypothetical protein